MAKTAKRRIQNTMLDKRHVMLSFVDDILEMS
jgi:hypothetical protein